MASCSCLTLLLLCCLLSWSRAIQVTPNSPCSSMCIDSTTLDTSDPNSSNTRQADITCQDKNYGSSTASIKWQNCMSCLQNSTFSQGSENDQMWFLYNMRFSLSSCIFGFPNSTNATTSPCITSFACGPLAKPLEDGILTPSDSTQYGYCSVDNSAATHQVFSRCSSCIAAGEETQYLANYVVALDAGCAQKPSPGHILGLNGSIFSRTTIGLVDPTLATPSATPNSGSNAGVPSNIIAAIVSVVVIVFLILAAFVFIRLKKRQNRRKRASYAAKYKLWGGSGTSQLPQSPLSFQCKTQMGPTSPKFFDDDQASHRTTVPAPTSRQSSFHKPFTNSSFQPISAVTEIPLDSKQPQRESRISIHQNPLAYHPAASSHPVPLHSLNTNPVPLPSYPTPTHASPLSSSQARFSPDSYTPTSAVSTRSNAPLLPAYVPAQHAATPSLRGPHNITLNTSLTTSPIGVAQHAALPIATRTPLLRNVSSFSVPRDSSAAGGNRDSSATIVPPPAPPPKSPRMMVGVAIDGVEGLVNFKVPKGRLKNNKESGSPTESRRVVSVFPPPPPPRR